MYEAPQKKLNNILPTSRNLSSLSNDLLLLKHRRQLQADFFSVSKNNTYWTTRITDNSPNANLIETVRLHVAKVLVGVGWGGLTGFKFCIVNTHCNRLHISCWFSWDPLWRFQKFWKLSSEGFTCKSEIFRTLGCESDWTKWWSKQLSRSCLISYCDLPIGISRSTKIAASKLHF